MRASEPTQSRDGNLHLRELVLLSSSLGASPVLSGLLLAVRRYFRRGLLAACLERTTSPSHRWKTALRQNLQMLPKHRPLPNRKYFW